MWCGDAVCWEITGQEAWPNPAPSRQYNPYSDPCCTPSDHSVQHRWTLLTFSLLHSWIAVLFFAYHLCISSILNLDAINENNQHLLQWWVVQCLNCIKNSFFFFDASGGLNTCLAVKTHFQRFWNTGVKKKKKKILKRIMLAILWF